MQPRWGVSAFDEFPLEPKQGTADNCEAGEVVSIGTAGPDILADSSPTSCLVGLDGKDELLVFGQADDSTLLGGSGRDRLISTSTVEFTRMAGGGGPDLLIANGGAAAMWGQRGADDLYGGFGDDLLDGGRGPDILDGHGGSDVLRGGSGHDGLFGGWGDDQLVGGLGADWLLGDGWGQWGDDELRGEGGDDWLEGRGGADSLRGGTGDDVLLGGPGDDELRGGPGEDFVQAGPGDDAVYIDGLCELVSGEIVRGGPGHDILYTPVDIDTLSSLGVVVQGFEQVVLHDGVAACDGCGCALVEGELQCCSGVGACDQVGDAPDGAVCTCPEGLLGTDCSVDPALTYFDEPEDPTCTGGDPSCTRSFDADEFAISAAVVDWTARPECSELDHVKDADFIPGLEALVYYPSQAPGQWAEGEFPLVILGPGNNIGTATYANTASHWARNGYVVVIAGPDSNLARTLMRADMLVCMTRIVRELGVAGSPIGDHVTQGVSLAGHSRGGEAVLVAASYLDDLGEETPTAVISMAPTSRCTDPQFAPGDCGRYLFDDDEDSLTKDRAAMDDGIASGFLLMEGSRDGDRTGEGITVFDVAVPEVLGGVRPDDATIKSMLWIFDVAHRGWTGGFAGESSERGALFARAYPVAFLDWLVGGFDTRAFFTGDETPPCVTDPGLCGDFDLEEPPVFFQQFRDGGASAGARHIPVRTFEADPTLEDPFGDIEGRGELALLGDITQFDGQLDAEDTSQDDFIFGRSARVRVPQGQSRITFPLDAPPFSPVNAIQEGLSYLSVRVSFTAEPDPGTSLTEEQCDALAASQADRRLNLQVSMVDALDNAFTVDTVDFQELRVADVSFVTQSNGAMRCEYYAFWTTIRIPLAAFSGVLKTQLSSIEIAADIEDSVHDGSPLTFLLDSVELVGNDADGVCGNGVKDGPEGCDGNDFGGATCDDFGQTGPLSCTDSCTLDTSECVDPGGDCPFGTPGCPGGECLEIPTGAGVAAYFQDGRYCQDETSICREDAPNVYSCHDCGDPEDSGVGCPCADDDACGPGPLSCFGSVPNLPGVDLSVPGACFAALPGDYCDERCGATDRTCGSLLGVDTVCIIEACGPPCEVAQPGTVCDRDTEQCVPACIDDLQCGDGQVCAPWGECWG